MKAALYFLSILLLLDRGTLPPQSYTQETTVIAGWNIQGFEPISAGGASCIAKVIGKINPDLIALLEVNPNEVTAQIVQELGSAYQPSVLFLQMDND